jgi:hypothetical protein
MDTLFWGCFTSSIENHKYLLFFNKTFIEILLEHKNLHSISTTHLTICNVCQIGLLFAKNVSNKPPILIAVSLNGYAMWSLIYFQKIPLFHSTVRFFSRVTAWSAELEQENEKSPIRNFNLTFLRSIQINPSNDMEPDATTCAIMSPIKPNQNPMVVMSQRKIVTKVDPALESPTRYTHNHSSNITTCCFAVCFHSVKTSKFPFVHYTQRDGFLKIINSFFSPLERIFYVAWILEQFWSLTRR